MNKLKAILVVFQKGSMVADPAAWKRGQIGSGIMVALLWAILELTGYDTQIGSETVDAVAVGLVALINGLLTIATTERLGLSPKSVHD